MGMLSAPKVIGLPFINFLVILIGRALGAFLPCELVKRIPLNGVHTIRLEVCGESFSILMASDGRDSFKNSLYWCGLAGFEPRSVSSVWPIFKWADTFFDIGANTGVYALIAKSANTAITIEAFEPVPNICSWLVKNCEINDLGDIGLNTYPLADEVALKTFYINETRFSLPTSASLQSDFIAQHSQLLRVGARILDDFVDSREIGSRVFLKVDVEGAEVAVLTGGQRFLKKFRPLIMCEFLDEASFHDVARLVSCFDYQIMAIGDSGPFCTSGEYCSSAENNYLLIPPDVDFQGLRGLPTT